MSRFVSPITDLKALGSVSFFDSNTNAPKITYKDEFENIENLLIIPVDANGNLPNIWFSGSASVIYLDQFDVQYAARNPVGEETGIGNFTGWNDVVIYDIPDITIGSNDKYYKSITDTNQGNDPISDSVNWEEIRFIGVWNTNILYAIGDIVQTLDGNLWKALTATGGNNPSVDSGENWEIAVEIIDLWEPPKTADFDLVEGQEYLIDGSLNTVDGSLPPIIEVGQQFIVHNESISTNSVRVLNPDFTIKGVGDSLLPGENLILKPGDTANLVARSSSTLEVV